MQKSATRNMSFKEKKESFVKKYHPLASAAGEAFRLNPVVILAQAAIESGWGTSTLSTRYHNFFGITAYGKSNDYWDGDSVQMGGHQLKFRLYGEDADSFMDYARLIRHAYPRQAELTFNPAAFATAISESKYISEVNGDNREAYSKCLASLCRTIGRIIKELIIKNEE